ncbi:MAG TPA: pyruvate ferredoxin oxidoreductase [Deltaproteobacteria bacterium]|nr:pyruvate ferredoxin oxidoreductase [Deltaproteobacteria bacterium]
MLQYRFHGRGGQGTVVATILLAKAFFKAGYYVQSFPLFGVERRGAPVEAYLRIDREKIWIRTNLYNPDHVVVLDKTLFFSTDVTRGLKKGGWILLNSDSFPVATNALSGYNLAIVDATRIALKHGLGTRTHPIVNTAMLGAFSKVHGVPPMDAIVGAIYEEVALRPEANVQAAREAYESVRLFDEPAGAKEVG